MALEVTTLEAISFGLRIASQFHFKLGFLDSNKNFALLVEYFSQFNFIIPLGFLRIK